MNAQKIGEHETEIEKIKSVFLAILWGIKNYMDNGAQPGGTATVDVLQTMQEKKLKFCKWLRERAKIYLEIRSTLVATVRCVNSCLSW